MGAQPFPLVWLGFSHLSMTRWGKKNPMNPSFWKDIGTFIIISSRSLWKDFKVLCLFMCMCVYACECSVHRHQKGCHFQIEWQLWANPPTAGAWLESSVRATYALNGLAIFLACKHVILLCIYLWVRVLAYHSLCVKVKGQLLSVLSFHHELQAFELGPLGTWQESSPAEPSCRSWT